MAFFRNLFTGEPELKLKVCKYDEGNDSYILDNAIRLSPKSAKTNIGTQEKYIAYLSPNQDFDKKENNFKKIAYPVIFDDEIIDGEILENSQIRDDLKHYPNSPQLVELKKLDLDKSAPINGITLQMCALVPRLSNEKINISKTRLIQSIRDTFTSNKFPLSLGQVLVIEYQIDDPRYKKFTFNADKKLNLKIRLKVSTMNGETQTKESGLPAICYLNDQSILLLTKVPGININFTNEEVLKPIENNSQQIHSVKKSRLHSISDTDEDISHKGIIKLNPGDFPELIKKDFTNENDGDKNSFQFQSLTDSLNDLNLPDQQPELQNGLPSNLSLDFARCGIGGSKKALRELVSQVFYSRAMGQYASHYGSKPVKGVLLYGPPGTGKTSIARAIADFFPNKNVHKINGPALRSKFVGESESQLREVFASAKRDWSMYGKNSPLHIIIFDEIDSAFPPRGSRTGGTGVDDNMTSQMLCLMDGLDNIENILVIGTTNRPDLIDDALKRENRLSLLLEINLPDKSARREILDLKTQPLRDSNLLQDEIDLDYWAQKTRGFSGADIEQLVRIAGNYAQSRNFDYDDQQNTLQLNKQITGAKDLETVSNLDFEKAYLNIKPSNRIDKAEFDFDRNQFVIYNDHIHSIIDEFDLCLDNINKPYSHQISFILSGQRGAGKTDLAKYLAGNADYDCMKLITTDSLLGKPLQKQLDYLDESFVHARRAESSVIILDNLEGILSASGDTLRKENSLVLKFITLLNPSKSNNKCIILATTQEIDALNKIGLLACFDEQHSMMPIQLSPDLNSDSLTTLDLLAKSLQITLTSTRSLTEHTHPDISLPIKQVIYLLKKLANHNQSVDLEEFYQMVNVKSESKEIRFASPKTKKESLGQHSIFKIEDSQNTKKNNHDVEPRLTISKVV